MAELERRTAQIGPRREGVAPNSVNTARRPRHGPAPIAVCPGADDGPTDLSPYRTVHPRRMGAAARRHAADADRRRGRCSCNRSTTRSRSTRSSAIYLPLSRLLVALRRGDAGAVQGDAALPARRERRQGALHHRGRRLGRGRQVDHGARAEGAAGALAQHAEGRPRHHRRLPAAQRRAAAPRPDGAQGLSRELRHRRAPALPRRHQGRQAPRERAALLAPRLRRGAGRGDAWSTGPTS